ncbi:MAG TPA: acetyl-CoA carboxylase biotin carboxyl carrier protein [Myxococcota bacterium]|nr:acetyl-CoA carboxylase biotin carboxyl carrier protein [Myxococcota bacterium]HKK92869.1 acetyl-CoA carboxylase biotin carboxyl carrier protein [Longimicrobiales bacterium]
MIDLEFLERLIAAVDESSLDSIELERGGTRVRLAKTPDQNVTFGAAPAPAAPAPAPAPAAPVGDASASSGGDEAPADSHLIEVTSPMVGTFYRAPAPDAPPYVEVGDTIGEGATLCIIEAMKLMNELEAELSGSIAEICVENAEPVEYGQVLFRIDPS